MPRWRRPADSNDVGDQEKACRIDLCGGPWQGDTEVTSESAYPGTVQRVPQGTAWRSFASPAPHVISEARLACVAVKRQEKRAHELLQQEGAREGGACDSEIAVKIRKSSRPPKGHYRQRGRFITANTA